MQKRKESNASSRKINIETNAKEKKKWTREPGLEKGNYMRLSSVKAWLR